MFTDSVTRLITAYHGAMVDQALLAQAKRLSAAERVELADAILSTVDAESLPMSAEVAALIDARIAEADANPGLGRSWTDVSADLRSRIR